MLTVDDYAKIRVAHRDGMSIREIARTFEHSRRKVREILAQPQPTPTRAPSRRRRRCWAPFTPIIDAILAADEDAPPKQRHTAMQVFRRLRDEHDYTGGYDQVRRYVGKHRRRSPRDLHPAGPRSRASGWKPTSATSTSISPTAGGWCRC